MKIRWKYLIDKEFQTRMIVRVIIFICVAIIISGLISYTVAVQIEKHSRVQLYGASDEYHNDVVTVSRLEVVRPVIVRSLLIGGVLGVLMATIFMIFYSHRLAGPMYRVEEHLKNMVEGNSGAKLEFRKKDEFKQLADAINELQDRLNRKS